MSDLTEKGIHVLSLINSKAVRDHLRKTGKEFSPLETAWLIRHNRYMWLEKKCRAWEERALKALSDLRKGRIDEVAFAAVCHAVRMQNLAETAEAGSFCTGYGIGVSV